MPGDTKRELRLLRIALLITSLTSVALAACVIFEKAAPPPQAPGPSASASGSARSTASAMLPPIAAQAPSASSKPAQDLEARDRERAKQIPDRIRKRLVALRDRPVTAADPPGCGRFTALGPAVVSNPISNGFGGSVCNASVQLIKCLETPRGLYVPVDDEKGNCGWVLWFVPPAGEPLALKLDLMEGEFQYSVHFALDDMDADGVSEVVLGSGAEHPEGVWSGTSFQLISPGADVALPFNGVRDVDGDGRMDGVLDFSATEGNYLCELARDADSQDVWSTIDLTVSPVVAHRLEHGGFTLTDAVARKAREKDCASPIQPVVATDARGVVEEHETMRRLVCALADGGKPGPLRAAIEAACPIPFEAQPDCSKRRPKVCRFRDAYFSVLDRLRPFPTWFVSGEPGSRAP